MNTSPFKTIMERKKEIQLDEDPGTTEMVIVGVDSVKIEDIGREKLRLVCNPDEKMEQKLAYETTCAFRPRLVIYDLMMRNYIKNKYNVEIPSLAEKWRRLCWNCFNPDDNLQCCSICKIAQYCTIRHYGHTSAMGRRRLRYFSFQESIWRHPVSMR